VAALLLDHGARVDGAGPDGKTPLMFAAMFDQVAVVDLLLTRGAAPDRQDVSGNTAASLARGMSAARAATRLDPVTTEGRTDISH
jgi:ankyrin repeat protein